MIRLRGGRIPNTETTNGREDIRLLPSLLLEMINGYTPAVSRQWNVISSEKKQSGKPAKEREEPSMHQVRETS